MVWNHEGVRYLAHIESSPTSITVQYTDHAFPPLSHDTAILRSRYLILDRCHCGGTQAQVLLRPVFSISQIL